MRKRTLSRILPRARSSTASVARLNLIRRIDLIFGVEAPNVVLESIAKFQRRSSRPRPSAARDLSRSI